MANFRTHAATSAILGAAYGTAAHVAYDVPLPACLLSGGLCTLAGLFPDVDSDHAVVLREILAFVAAVVPMLLLDHFREQQWTQESIIVAAGLIYMLVRFGVGDLLRRFTIHRGMWHSLPAAAATSLVVYVLCACPDERMRWFKTAAFALGFVWHLLLDEIYAVESSRGRLRVKRSFGTAFKLWGSSPLANLTAYTALVGLAMLVARSDEALTPTFRRPAPQSQLTPVPPLHGPQPRDTWRPPYVTYDPGQGGGAPSPARGTRRDPAPATEGSLSDTAPRDEGAPRFDPRRFW